MIPGSINSASPQPDPGRCALGTMQTDRKTSGMKSSSRVLGVGEPGYRRMPLAFDCEAVLVTRRVSEDHLLTTQSTAFSSAD
ncbi:hypothetical protein CA85_09140 [Allorhodopirellula solitaria]|uniref:Uncharacterized protein n=1 Tax=Allorhodopirellula solitaria TaxID=2527987 RepID=A0A5C5YFG2_9BACT|nr:hypothetical protein CA85_09140 [Allorhodopirellula solitaria]